MLTSNSEITEKGRAKVSFLMKASQVFKGSMVMLTAGLLGQCGAVASSVFAGISMENIDNSADEGLACEVQREGVFLLSGVGFTQADVGKDVYALDDEIVQLAAGTNLVKVGKINSVESATLVYVDINTL